VRGKGIILAGMAPPSVAEALGCGRDSDGDREKEEAGTGTGAGRGDVKDGSSVDGKYTAVIRDRREKRKKRKKIRYPFICVEAEKYQSVSCLLLCCIYKLS
jgi:hypothetical protein